MISEYKAGDYIKTHTELRLNENIFSIFLVYCGDDRLNANHYRNRMPSAVGKILTVYNLPPQAAKFIPVWHLIQHQHPYHKDKTLLAVYNQQEFNFTEPPPSLNFNTRHPLDLALPTKLINIETINNTINVNPVIAWLKNA